MGDVARALLLPDVGIPTDQLVKTLSLYWDQLVIPDYVERAGLIEADPSGVEQPLSETFSTLAEEGVLVIEKRSAELPPVDPAQIPESLRDVDVPFESVRRIFAVVSPFDEIVNERRESKKEIDHDKLETAGKKMLDNLVDYAARQYVQRVRDAFQVAQAHHLAPVSGSAVSHVASMVGMPSDVPRTEAALLSTAIKAFELAPDTPVERIVEFREKHAASLGRFRASLVDLSEGLRADAHPTQLLGEAHDRYRNRVVPALGELEDALSQGKIRFFLRSVMGATALSLAPIKPVKAVEGGVTLVGQTIEYSFSREKLIQEHPFGYLHQVSKTFGVDEMAMATRALEDVVDDPENQVLEIFRSDIRNSPLLSQVTSNFWFGSKDLEEEEDQV